MLLEVSQRKGARHKMTYLEAFKTSDIPSAVQALERLSICKKLDAGYVPGEEFNAKGNACFNLL